MLLFFCQRKYVQPGWISIMITFDFFIRTSSTETLSCGIIHWLFRINFKFDYIPFDYLSTDIKHFFFEEITIILREHWKKKFIHEMNLCNHCYMCIILKWNICQNSTAYVKPLSRFELNETVFQNYFLLIFLNFLLRNWK